MATYDNAQLVKMSGLRDPYPSELGVVKEGALPDLLLINGNPLENLDLVADPDRNFVLIIKKDDVQEHAQVTGGRHRLAVSQGPRRDEACPV